MSDSVTAEPSGWLTMASSMSDSDMDSVTADTPDDPNVIKRPVMLDRTSLGFPAEPPDFPCTDGWATLIVTAECVRIYRRKGESSDKQQDAVLVDLKKSNVYEMTLLGLEKVLLRVAPGWHAVTTEVVRLE